MGRSPAFSQDPETLSFNSQALGVIHSFSRGNPETWLPADPSFPTAVPRSRLPSPAFAGPLDPGFPEARESPRAGAWKAETLPPHTHRVKNPGKRRLFFLNHRLAGLRDPLLKTPESSASLCLSPRFPACQSVAVNRDRVGKLPPPPTTRIKKKITVHFTYEEVGASGLTTLPQLQPG